MGDRPQPGCGACNTGRRPVGRMFRGFTPTARPGWANQGFQERFPPRAFRVVNGMDIVADVPPKGPYRHVGEPYGSPMRAISTSGQAPWRRPKKRLASVHQWLQHLGSEDPKIRFERPISRLQYEITSRCFIQFISGTGWWSVRDPAPGGESVEKRRSISGAGLHDESEPARRQVDRRQPNLMPQPAPATAGLAGLPLQGGADSGTQVAACGLRRFHPPARRPGPQAPGSRPFCRNRGLRAGCRLRCRTHQWPPASFSPPWPDAPPTRAGPPPAEADRLPERGDRFPHLFVFPRCAAINPRR